jgi:hypothetical protein
LPQEIGQNIVPQRGADTDLSNDRSYEAAAESFDLEVGD